MLAVYCLERADSHQRPPSGQPALCPFPYFRHLETLRSAMGHSEIPADVWIHVMHQLEDEYVRDRANRLHEISSLFLQVSLDRRYRALELTDVKQRSLTMLEERLK